MKTTELVKDFQIDYVAMSRVTRLANAFSKKLENREAAIALHCTFYNFGRAHQPLRVTPAMEAGNFDRGKDFIGCSAKARYAIVWDGPLFDPFMESAEGVIQTFTTALPN